jgi:hypothetical protein
MLAMRNIAKNTWLLTLVGWALLGNAIAAEAYSQPYPYYGGSSYQSNPYGGYPGYMPPGSYYSRTTTHTTTYYGYPRQYPQYPVQGYYPYPGYVYPTGCWYSYCQPFPYYGGGCGYGGCGGGYRFPRQVFVGVGPIAVNVVY